MGGPDKVSRPLNRAGVIDHEGQQLAVDLFVEGVNFIVLVADGARACWIAVLERLEAPHQHFGGNLRHSWDVDVRLERRLIREHESNLGDSLGVVAHSLQVDRDMKDRDDSAEIAGQWLLGRD